jgi:hypothetical protein
MKQLNTSKKGRLFNGKKRKTVFQHFTGFLLPWLSAKVGVQLSGQAETESAAAPSIHGNNPAQAFGDP